VGEGCPKSAVAIVGFDELRDIFTLPLLAALSALDDWLAYASRSKLAAFVKLARTIRHYRAAIEATIEWKLTNGIAESNNAAIGRIRANARRLSRPRRVHHHDHARPRRPGPRASLDAGGCLTITACASHRSDVPASLPYPRRRHTRSQGQGTPKASENRSEAEARSDP
jgi:hypothetical protein